VESAARIPVGTFRYAFPLSARLHPAPTSEPPSPGPTAVSASPPDDLAPYGSYLGLRLPADHRLQRLTPLTCVYDAATLHVVCGHTLRGQRLADSANHWHGFRMLSPSGQILSAPNITVADVRLDAHCDVCTRTQMQAAPSHRNHPRAGRKLAAAVACPAVFGLADISASLLATDGPWYPEPTPVPTWGQWLQPITASPTPPFVSVPALVPATGRTDPEEEGECYLSASSDYDSPAPGRCPTSCWDVNVSSPATFGPGQYLPAARATMYGRCLRSAAVSARAVRGMGRRRVGRSTAETHTGCRSPNSREGWQTRIENSN
jgi:hypothetical protein